MSRIYKVALEINEDTFRYLQNCCLIYHEVFNTALQIQETTMDYGLTHEEQLMDLNILTEKVQNVIESYDKIEKGII